MRLENQVAQEIFDDDRLAATFERLPQLLDKNPNLIRHGTFLDARFQVGIGTIPFDVGVAAGRITLLERGPFVMRSWRFAIRGNSEAWGQWWKPIPEPGWHDLFALTKSGCMVLEGDLQPLMANLQYLKDLLVLPRHVGGRRNNGRSRRTDSWSLYDAGAERPPSPAVF